MRILAIETSCDETALALIEASFSPAPTFKVLGESLYSQTELHAQYGGVFPMMAKREHCKNLVPLLVALFAKTGIAGAPHSVSASTKQEIALLLERESDLSDLLMQEIDTLPVPDIDCIAVTVGPGLEPCLWTGINFARVLATLWKAPVVPANHMEGHIYSVLAGSAAETRTELAFPALALLISGGHTELVYVRGYGTYEIIGKTRDDAVGEAFDKVARILGLPYPGGPKLSALAAEARAKQLPAVFPVPRPMLHSKDLDFSFSGLKTAVLYGTQKLGTLDETQKAAIARETEDAIVEVLTEKTRDALERFPAQSLIVGGGVIANSRIRTTLETLARDRGIAFHMPTKELSTDNAVMIGLAGAFGFRAGKTIPLEGLKAEGNLSL
jgi:N6-L-threonylcarbamoyladenine synthase